MMPAVDEYKDLVQENVNQKLTLYGKQYNASVVAVVQAVTFAFP